MSSRLNTEREYHIAQNYPNPFNSTTVFRYRLARPAHVTLTIYDVTGREVIRLVDQKQPAGNFKVVWNGKNRQKQTVASGLYFYKFEAGKRTVLKKCLLIK
ncbi:MAG TPA: T9SS type A sorting domain-containing protein [Caldithrix abyssi]|uniref:T9SS type A sorting domain-containing protein n=1 Tax=Caldithrix abyssi TaxID=187145 RepID=A0A7V5UFV5_CALAY|nr:T9SS type A sorting domain-containing protein [Caldithrix abyssi]